MDHRAAPAPPRGPQAPGGTPAPAGSGRAPGVDPATPAARALLDRGRALHRALTTVVDADGAIRRDVVDGYAGLRRREVHRQLAAIPVERLRASVPGLRTGPLRLGGVTTVADVLGTRPHRLEAMPGVGPATAAAVLAAARAVADAIGAGVRVRVELDPDDAVATRLLAALHSYREVQPQLGRLRGPAARLAGRLGPALAQARPASGRVRMLLSGPHRRREAVQALDRLAWEVDRAERDGTAGRVTALAGRLAERPAAARVWRDFERHSADYYALLAEVVGLGPPVEAVEGHLPGEIAARVRRQPLDGTYRRVTLRGYQAFGARFALAQRRVIIGDEMGLGKTIQAIAVLAHLRAGGATQFLVVCPASVLVNWTREISGRSALLVHRLHGPNRAAAVAAWCRDGGVGVTTVDSLHDLPVPPGMPVDALVLDEAHYAKNPRTRRSRAVRDWTRRTDQVLFLSGTPMENRVDEFRALVDLLDPDRQVRVAAEDAVAGAVAFRRAVAPVYLRRNQEDVLAELPELVRVDEWVEFTAPDARAYRQAVVSGNFMAMRRAGYAAGDPGRSAKLRRLVELVDEATGNGRHVVVFSFFRDVCDTVCRTLDGRAFGPLTGAVPAEERQRLVDRFADAPGGAVLVSQIQAGGVGLNIQAASVVIICEPQVKPTIEEQAIGRSHRMGQVRGVQVHRLLTPDSVDARMLEILATKTNLFNQYARRSDLAGAAAEAIDPAADATVTEAELARRVVAAEQRRLSVAPD